MTVLSETFEREAWDAFWSLSPPRRAVLPMLLNGSRSILPPNTATGSLVDLGVADMVRRVGSGFEEARNPFPWRGSLLKNRLRRGRPKFGKTKEWKSHPKPDRKIRKRVLRMARVVRWLWDGPKSASQWDGPSGYWLAGTVQQLVDLGIVARIPAGGQFGFSLNPTCRGDARTLSVRSVPYPMSVGQMIAAGYGRQFFAGRRAWSARDDEERNLVCVSEKGLVLFAGGRPVPAELVFLMTPAMRFDARLEGSWPGLEKMMVGWLKRADELRIMAGLVK
jgi:hypothetical protein